MIFSPIFESAILEIIIITFYGLVFGSFASALTYRVPRGMSWATKGATRGREAHKAGHGLRSACPSCKTLLTIRDLIPIFSWLMTRGTCRHCKAPISKTYPICELLTLAACLGIYAAYGLTWYAIPLLLMIPFLTALVMIDFEHMILPNQLVAITFALGVLSIALKVIGGADMLDTLIKHLSGVVLFVFVSWSLAFIMKKLLKKEALGFGDVKFFAVAGLWLGMPAIGSFCIIAGVAGVALGMIWQKITGNAAFPFGPALILSFYGLLILQGSHFL